MLYDRSFLGGDREGLYHIIICDKCLVIAVSILMLLCSCVMITSVDELYYWGKCTVADTKQEKERECVIHSLNACTFV